MDVKSYLNKVRSEGADLDSMFIILVTGSLLCIIILTCMVFIQGPRIREVTFNPELSTQNSGQWILMHTNLPLGMIQGKQVMISPATPFSVLSSGNEVAVQFKQRLSYDSHYTVKVATGSVTLQYGFKTPKGVCFYLVSPGTLKEHTVGDAVDQTVYQAPFINEFALTGDYLAVVEPNGSTDSLVIVNTKTKKSYDADLPQAGTIQNIKASPDGQDFSFTFTSLEASSKPNYNTDLFSLDVLTNKVVPVYGFNHQLLQATDWTYSPDGLAMVVQTFSSVIEAVYLNSTTPPLPIGAYSIIDGFSYDGTHLYVGTLKQGTENIDLDTRKGTYLDQTPLGSMSNLELVAPLPNSAGYVMQVQEPIATSANYAQYVMLVTSSGQRTLYASRNGADAIASVSVSPNDEYVAIGVSPTSATQPGSGTLANTVIVSTATGKIVDTIPSLEQVVWE
ncbi:MAG TPA: hypothetical protein VMB52_06805 [Verrucomicrobiae bacterium]|nr:hypothetical protein [Verrucomicrobiae bacterium]